MPQGHAAKRGRLGVRLSAAARNEVPGLGGAGAEHRGAAASHGRAEMLKPGTLEGRDSWGKCLGKCLGYIYIHMFFYIYIYTCKSIYMYEVDEWIRYIYIYIYIYVYVYIHTYIHTYIWCISGKNHVSGKKWTTMVGMCVYVYTLYLHP